LLGDREKRIAEQHEKSKLTTRERINLLVDSDNYEEFDIYVTHQCHDFGMSLMYQLLSWIMYLDFYQEQVRKTIVLLEMESNFYILYPVRIL